MSGVRQMGEGSADRPDRDRDQVVAYSPLPAAAARRVRSLLRGLEGAGALLGNAYGAVARRVLTRAEGLEDRLAERQALRQRRRAQSRPSSPSQTDS